MELPLSPSSASVASSSTRLVAGSQLKSKLVFDYVEIPQPEWYGGRREKISTSSRRTRKRIKLADYALNSIVAVDSSL